MGVDYKKELEGASRTMILVHEPEILIRMIVRMFVQKVKVKHAAILLQDKTRDTYVLTVSRGLSGLKIPRGFARMDPDNPLINFFRKRLDKKYLNDGAILYDDIKRQLKKKLSPEAKKMFKDIIYQMEIFEAHLCVPSYFRDELLGILLLGGKRNGRKFGGDELDFFTALAYDVAMAIRNAQLFSDLQQELDKKQRLFINTTIALAAAIEAKDRYTHGHTSRVTNLSLKIAHKLSRENKEKFDAKFLERLHIASLLHDIGKIGVPESILNKNGPLDEPELKRMREHPTVGVNILAHINELQESLLGVKYHHEKYDGSGYPEGLKGKEIPLIASIISAADTFDAMTTDRPYRKGLSAKEAIEEISRASGRQFDPQVVNALVELYREKKI